MVTEADVMRTLDGIGDPCSAAAGAPGSIVEMGLVRSVTVDRGIVGVDLWLTEPTCLMGPAFVRTARERIAGLPGVTTVDVVITSGLDWRPSDMRPEYAARLAEARRARTDAVFLGVPRYPSPQHDDSAATGKGK